MSIDVVIDMCHIVDDIDKLIIDIDDDMTTGQRYLPTNDLMSIDVVADMCHVVDDIDKPIIDIDDDMTARQWYRPRADLTSIDVVDDMRHVVDDIHELLIDIVNDIVLGQRHNPSSASCRSMSLTTWACRRRCRYRGYRCLYVVLVWGGSTKRGHLFTPGASE